MSGRRNGDDESFADAMRDVVPDPDRETRVPKKGARGRSVEPKAVHFDHPDPEEPLLGVAQGIQKAQLRRLRTGKIRPEVEIDLHGMRAAEARAHLHERLLEAVAAEARCAIVIHGRGSHSKKEPVLRGQLPAWLAHSRVGPHVLAFAPAQPDEGGRGATYVLLRRHD